MRNVKLASRAVAALMSASMCLTMLPAPAAADPAFEPQALEEEISAETRGDLALDKSVEVRSGKNQWGGDIYEEFMFTPSADSLYKFTLDQSRANIYLNTEDEDGYWENEVDTSSSGNGETVAFLKAGLQYKCSFSCFDESGDYIYPKLKLTVTKGPDFTDMSTRAQNGESFNIVAGKAYRVTLDKPGIWNVEGSGSMFNADGQEVDGPELLINGNETYYIYATQNGSMTFSFGNAIPVINTDVTKSFKDSKWYYFTPEEAGQYFVDLGEPSMIKSVSLSDDGSMTKKSRIRAVYVEDDDEEPYAYYVSLEKKKYLVSVKGNVSSLENPTIKFWRPTKGSDLSTGKSSLEVARRVYPYANDKEEDLLVYSECQDDIVVNKATDERSDVWILHFSDDYGFEEIRKYQGENLSFMTLKNPHDIILAKTVEASQPSLEEDQDKAISQTDAKTTGTQQYYTIPAADLTKGKYYKLSVSGLSGAKLFVRTYNSEDECWTDWSIVEPGAGVFEYLFGADNDIQFMIVSEGLGSISPDGIIAKYSATELDKWSVGENNVSVKSFSSKLFEFSVNSANAGRYEIYSEDGNGVGVYKVGEEYDCCLNEKAYTFQAVAGQKYTFVLENQRIADIADMKLYINKIPDAAFVNDECSITVKCSHCYRLKPENTGYLYLALPAEDAWKLNMELYDAEMKYVSAAKYGDPGNGISMNGYVVNGGKEYYICVNPWCEDSELPIETKIIRMQDVKGYEADKPVLALAQKAEDIYRTWPEEEEEQTYSVRAEFYGDDLTYDKSVYYLSPEKTKECYADYKKLSEYASGEFKKNYADLYSVLTKGYEFVLAKEAQDKKDAEEAAKKAAAEKAAAEKAATEKAAAEKAAAEKAAAEKAAAEKAAAEKAAAEKAAAEKAAAEAAKKPAAVKKLAGTLKNNKLTISFKKNKDATSYEVAYSTKKSFAKKQTKVKTVKKAKVTIKNLKKKVYYVRVRAVKNVNGKKVYGKWTAAKRIKKK